MPEGGGQGTFTGMVHEEDLKMKKRLLLGTTALATAALMTGAANAQIEMRLGGYMVQWFGYGDNDGQYNLNETNQWSNSEVHFLGRGVTDNGLVFGVNVQLEANTVGDQIDESFLFISSDRFGTINLGSENDAAYLMQVAAPSVALAVNSGTVTQHIANPTRGNLTREPFGSTFITPARDNDGQKITYFTPRLFGPESGQGFQLGFSYLPQIDPTGGDRNALISNDANAATFDYANGWSVGLNYEGEFSGVSFIVSGGYYYAEAPDNFNTASGGTVAGVTGADGTSIVDLEDEFQAYSLGATMSYGGFTLGGSYAEVLDGRLTPGTTATGRTVGTQAAPALTSVFIGGTSTRYGAGVRTSEGQGWDVGISYEQGPWAVSFTYFDGETDGIITVPGEDQYTAYMGGARYNLGSSIALVGSVGFVEFESEFTGTTVDTNGNGVNDGVAGGDSIVDLDNDGVLVTGGVAISF